MQGATPSRAVVAIAVALTLAPAGCGGSGSTSQPSATAANASATSSTSSGTGSTAAAGTATSTPPPTATSAAKTAPMTLSSPAIHAHGGKAGPIPARYTCAGADVPPSLHWRDVPAGTEELALFIAHIGQKLNVDWAVMGLKPALRGIVAGRLPADAIVGRNTHGQDGYYVCPPRKGKRQVYGVLLYALAKKIPTVPGFKGFEIIEKLSREAKTDALLAFH